jgi:O-antigen/teichoic acid export membrane protein
VKQQILSFGKDITIYGMGSVAVRFVGLVTLPLFTAYLTPEEYGVLGMLALLTMFAQPIFSLGLGGAMGPIYFRMSTTHDKGCVMWSAFAIVGISAGVMGAIGWAVSISLCSLIRVPAEYKILVSITITGCAMTVASTALVLRVQFEKQAKIFTAVSLISVCITVSFSVLSVVCWNWGVRGMVYGQLIGNAATFIGFFAVAALSSKPVFSRSMALELLRSGFTLMPSFIFLFVIAQANKYILEWERGLDSVGIYSIGFGFGAVIGIFVNAITTAWYPFFISYIDRQNQAKVLFGRVFSCYVFGVGSLVVCFFFFAHPLVELLLPSQYADAAQVIGFVAAGHFFIGMFNLLLPPAHFKRDFTSILLSQFIASLISIVVYFLLIHFWGLVGAGLSYMFGHAFMAFMLHLSNRKKCGDTFVIIFEVRRLIKISIIYLFSIGLFWWINFSYSSGFALYQEFVFSFVCTLALFVATYCWVFSLTERKQFGVWATNFFGSRK